MRVPCAFSILRAGSEGSPRASEPRFSTLIPCLALLPGFQVPMETFLKAAPSDWGRAPFLKGTCPHIGPGARGAPQNWTVARRPSGGLRPRPPSRSAGPTLPCPACAARPTSRAVAGGGSWPRPGRSWPRPVRRWPRPGLSWPRPCRSWPRLGRSWPRPGLSWPHPDLSWPRPGRSSI